MKKNYLVFISILFLYITPHLTSTTTKSEKGFIIAPVTDALGSPFTRLEQYRHIPLCGGGKPSANCPRLHQLLFNEPVTVLNEQDGQYLVSISNVFYVTPANLKEQCTTYWVPKSTVITQTQLQKYDLPPSLFPEPIRFTDGNINTSPTTIALILPWYEPTTQFTFSVGTRFKLLHPRPRNNAYTVTLFNPKNGSVITAHIPTSHAFKMDPLLSGTERKGIMVKILRLWSTMNRGFIPYVLGGCSFTTLCQSDFVEMRDNPLSPTSWYEIPGYSMTPKTGFDCSGLVMRAAQIVGLAIFYKNTTTLGAYLVPLAITNASPELADLILIPGHVMVIADTSTTHPTLLEARGYPHMYGKIQELPLNKVFKDIDTYAQLNEAYREKKTIYRIDKDGVVRDTIRDWSIVRIPD